MARGSRHAAPAFFAGIIDPKLAAPKLRAADYADLYRSLIAGENVRPRVAVHPRLFIWGPFEARLQQTDVMVLGSLNDGTWPEAADPGPWLNRPMRAELGLPSPEEKIGHSAHDFTSFLGAPRVISRAPQKIDGVPTVPSRWLMRLKALLAGLGLGDALRPADALARAGRARATPGGAQRIRIAAPEPRPPLDLRPRRMSVTRVETWLRQPLCDLRARHPQARASCRRSAPTPMRALRGTIVHDASARFAQAHPDALPDDPERELMAIARDVIAGYDSHPRVAAFWLPRFARFAAWFAETEPARRNGVARTIAEVQGKLHTRRTGRPVHADGARRPYRLSRTARSSSPTTRPVRRPTTQRIHRRAGAAAAARSRDRLGEAGFAEVPQRTVSGLRYIRASGGEPPGEERVVACDDVADAGRSRRSTVWRASLPASTTQRRPTRRCAASASTTTTTTTRTWRASANGRRSASPRMPVP